MAETKVIYHGTTEANGSERTNEQGYPPPYPGPPPGEYPHPQPQPGYAAPGPSYPPPGPVYMQQQPVTATVITTQHQVVGGAVVIAQSMGPRPTAYTCKSCNHQIVTRVESKPTMRTHFFALLLCLLGCWPCVCIPYCMDDCLSTDHYCPNCNSYIGSYMN